jgi:hypothetical protein
MVGLELQGTEEKGEVDCCCLGSKAKGVKVRS